MLPYIAVMKSKGLPPRKEVSEIREYVRDALDGFMVSDSLLDCLLGLETDFAVVGLEDKIDIIANPTKKSQAFYYAGIAAQSLNRLDDARNYFSRSVSEGGFNCYEFLLAKSEL